MPTSRDKQTLTRPRLMPVYRDGRWVLAMVKCQHIQHLEEARYAAWLDCLSGRRCDNDGCPHVLNAVLQDTLAAQAWFEEQDRRYAIFAQSKADYEARAIWALKMMESVRFCAHTKEQWHAYLLARYNQGDIWEPCLWYHYHPEDILADMDRKTMLGYVHPFATPNGQPASSLPVFNMNVWATGYHMRLNSEYVNAPSSSSPPIGSTPSSDTPRRVRFVEPGLTTNCSANCRSRAPSPHPRKLTSANINEKLDLIEARMDARLDEVKARKTSTAVPKLPMPTRQSLLQRVSAVLVDPARVWCMRLAV